MSQFRVQKVTKVKGPSELSTSKSSESSTKKARANLSTTDRPQAQPRQKKTSTPPKLADGKNTQSSSDKASTNTSSSQRSTTRNRPTAAKRTTTKTCTSQQNRRNGSPQTATKQSRNKADIDSTKTAAPVKPSLPQRPTRQETTAKKSPPQIEKENSYDASGSDSDEPHLFGKLSPKDDVGYETGSFDEIDGSNSETTSPAAGEENKTIFSQNRKDDITEYSYAEVEFRPLIVLEEGGVSTPVPTAHQDKLQNTQPPRNVDNPIEQLSYAYAGEEFRPLIITDSGGIAAPLEGRKSTDQANSSPLVDQRRAPMRYEEVEVLGGKFDRANVDTSQLRTAMPAGSNHYGIPVENEDNTYEMVNQQNTSRTEQFTNARRQNFTSTNEEQDIGDIYAVVQKNKTKNEANISHKLSGASSLSSEIPPEIRPRFDITKSDLCESISGELQDMINSYSDDKIGKTSRSSSREGYSSSDSGKVAVRPPLPKPYSGSGIRDAAKENAEIEAASSDEDYEASPLYAAVQKKPKKKTPPKKSEPQLKEQSEEPPPLPSRTNLEEKDDTLGRDISLSQAEKESPEKSKKSGFGIFKKRHQRKMSDGNVISPTGEAFWYLSPGASNKGHKRSKSQDDMTKVMNNLLGDSGKSDSGNLIEPYLAVDITDPPNTPRELQKLNSYWEDKENEYDNDELPEGWKEVESENGTKYYWHIPSGTTQWERPQVSPRPKQMKKTVGEQPSSQAVDRQKVLSFPVHSMGWIELEENQVAPHNMSDTIADCISTLARNRKDLWQTSETWGEGKDIRLLLEGETLKLVEPRNKITLLVQPVSKMRVWGVGKEDHRDFAYVARDPNTGKHKCHMFRCHGNISGRAITTALHEMCNKILEEKKRAQEISKKNSQSKPWSDIINTPPPLSAKDGAAFNEKPYREQRKDFTATYLGSTDVPKPTGMEMLNKAINKVASKGGPKKTVLIQVTVSCIRITDCTSQEEISEDRVRFLSFMGVARDERLCGYVMVNEPDHFICHVFQCTPNAAPLTKALEEACQLRYQKALDAHPEMASKIIASQEQESDKAKDKQANFMSSVQGLLGKLSTKKSGGKKEDVVTAPPLPKPSHTFMVKYYGALPVAVGTGIETVEEAAKHLTGGTLLICQLDVAINGVTLYDSQRSALSRRHMDADTISFCGLTSDSGHFGLIQCQGGGKYVCHVFSEYKAKAAPIVAAIHETL